jgi:hypothetical protein
VRAIEGTTKHKGHGSRKRKLGPENVMWSAMDGRQNQRRHVGVKTTPE